MRPGQEFEATVGEIVGDGFCIARVGERDVRVRGAEPGDRVRLRVVDRRRGRVDAVTLEVIAPGPDRVAPACAHFGTCGGCARQDLAYSAQLVAKQGLVERAFEEAGVTDLPEIAPVVGADVTFGHRNKMEYSFGARRWLTPAEIASGEKFERGFALGLHVRERHDRVLDVTDCRLQPQIAMRLLALTRRFALARGVGAWDSATRSGMLRHLVVRTPAREPGVLVVLVTSGAERALVDEYAAMLRAELPEITTFVHTVNRGVAQVASGESSEIVFGDGLFRERLCGRRFTIGPGSFFQTNTAQAERLYGVAAEFAELAPDQRVIDLFCGLGTITLSIADRVREVVGIELDAAAVQLAERNARDNGVKNVRFAAGDALAALDAELAAHGPADRIIVDPPRAGLHPKLVERLATLAPTRVVYVSCNPRTLARDVALLANAYLPSAIAPVDLVPHSDHVEVVVRLDRIGRVGRATRAG